MHFICTIKIKVIHLLNKTETFMPTFKKPSKSMSFQNEKCNDLEKAIKALDNGAVIIEDKNGFAIEYPTGGYFKISKNIYKQIKLQSKKNIMNYNPTDKQKALDLANKLEFQETTITDNHMDTCLMLFMDDDNGTWSIDGTYYGKYKLSYEREKVACIEKGLEDQLDIFIEEERNSDEREQHEEEEYREHQNEMLRNTNRNHFY